MACLAWVCHSSLGFLLETVIFNLLCEEKGIILLLLLEGPPNAFERNCGAVYRSHLPVLHHDTAMEQGRVVSWGIAAVTVQKAIYELKKKKKS